MWLTRGNGPSLRSIQEFLEFLEKVEDIFASVSSDTQDHADAAASAFFAPVHHDGVEVPGGGGGTEVEMSSLKATAKELDTEPEEKGNGATGDLEEKVNDPRPAADEKTVPDDLELSKTLRPFVDEAIVALPFKPPGWEGIESGEGWWWSLATGGDGKLYASPGGANHVLQFEYIRGRSAAGDQDSWPSRL